MNRSGLIEKIILETKLKRSVIECVLDCTIDNIRKAVNKGDDVRLSKFGTFTKTKRKTRNGRNPQNGDKIIIPSKWTPKFKCSKQFLAGQ